MGILIRGGRVVDAAAQIDKIADVYLDDGVIQKVGEKLEAKDKDDKIIDAKGTGSNARPCGSSRTFS